jgi:D-alanyl-D-alanine carboxypeptidase
MNYLILINRNNTLDKNYIPKYLTDTCSKYKKGIKVVDKVNDMFLLMKLEALKYGYDIDIMSGYRDYDYQVKLYNKLIKDKGFNYAYRIIAPPGASEHQTGLAIDICVYRYDKCYVEHELNDFDEISWIIKNAHRFGFILRYPKGKEDITGYSYEPWHFRYVGNMASYLYFNNLTLEEYCK